MSNRPKGYGMTAELDAKKAAKHDPAMEAEAAAWIEGVTGEKITGGFQPGLQDGIILCKLINTLKPGSVKKINQGKMAFKMMENIGNFLTGCEGLGMNKIDLFQTVDLYEAANMPQVVNTIHALGRKAQKVGFQGPTLGPKESVGEKREFTDEQLREGQNVIGLQMGTNKGASQAGHTAYGLGRQIVNKPE